MSTVLLSVTGNTAPSFEATLKRSGAPIDLTNASVKLFIRREMTDVFTNTGHEGTVVTDAANGVITYSPLAGDFPKEGRYLGEAEITYTGGKIERVFELVTIPVRTTL